MRGQKVELKDGQVVVIQEVQGALVLVLDQKGSVRWIEQDMIKCLLTAK